MSVVRWGRVRTHGYDSDVYIYGSTEGVECCGCDLTTNRSGIIAHLMEVHDDHRVPEFVYDELWNYYLLYGDDPPVKYPEGSFDSLFGPNSGWTPS